MYHNKPVTIKVLPAFCILTVLVLTFSASAAISITGVTDQAIYTDSATFTVNSEAGWDYTATLNRNLVSTGVVTDVATVVDAPDYYQLYVHRINQTTSAEESLTVQFIIRDSARGSSETGLPTFTPYPPIDSAAAEFVGATLNIITPADYPIGLEIPVVARVNDVSRRVGVFGDVTAAGYEAYPLKLLRGVGSTFLPAATASGTINYNAGIHSLSTPKTINIEASTTWVTASGTISSNADWGTNARVHVNGQLTVAAGATLTIGEGSVIKVDPDLEIAVNGTIDVNGTNANPVVFTPADRAVPWGGFLFEAATSVGDFEDAIMTAACADSNWFGNNPGHGSVHRSEQCLLYLSNSANVSLTDCYMIDHYGQTGHSENSYLTMTRCLVQQFITIGEYNGGSVTLNDSALIEFPSYNAPFADADNDGLYLTTGNHYLTDTLIGWALDDAVDAGSGNAGTVNIDNCWFESAYHEAMAWSGYQTRTVTVTDTVAINSGQGIESGWQEAYVTATNCLSTANMVGARLGDNYTNWAPTGILDVQDSLLLYNYRDVWGRAWSGDWSERIGQMTILNNYVSIPHASFPTNTLWDPIGTPSQADELIPFLPTPATTVGIGLAVKDNTLDISEITGQVPVRLSTFTTNVVSIDYTIEVNGGAYDSGTLQFAPGESVKDIEFTMPPAAGLDTLKVSILNPVNAELTGYQQVTYSIPYEIATDHIVIGDDWLYRKGTSEPPSNWNDLTFTPDGTWLTGPTPIGYENSSGYESCIATDLTDMSGSYYSVYARKVFNVFDPSLMTSLVFGISYDDGYIAYINGVQVHSQNPPNPVAYNAQPSTDHEGSCGSTPQFDISGFIPVLVPGENVLAIQIHNKGITSSDFLLIPELKSVANPIPGDVEPDGDIDFQDFAALASGWMSTSSDAGYNEHLDIDDSPGDGTIDILDLRVLAENWLAGF